MKRVRIFFIAVISICGFVFSPGYVHAQSRTCSEVTSRADDIREWLRADSLRLTAIEIAIPELYVWQRNQDEHAKMNISIENCSGIGLGIVVREYGYSAGPCGVPFQPNRTDAGIVSGLGSMGSQAILDLMKDPNPMQKLRFLPAGAKSNGAIAISNDYCNASLVKGLQTVPISVTVVVSNGKTVLVVPLSTDNVPIRLVSTR